MRKRLLNLRRNRLHLQRRRVRAGVDSLAETNSGSVYKFYKIDGDKVTRSKRDCPRCGKGVFMAEHKDRLSCGKCGFTEFSKKDNAKTGS
jgi:ubiquitin-small subunit ribosomal protein S27Ae